MDLFLSLSLLQTITVTVMTSTFEIPTITPQDLNNFYQTHLSPGLHKHFTRTFLHPKPQIAETQSEHELEHPFEGHDEGEEEGEGVEDDLGYYPDGTKRTLTPAQVEMFRFSEVQSILKKRRRTAAKKQAAKDRRAQREEEEEAMDLDPPMPPPPAAEEGEEISELDRAKNRLQAAVWASSQVWDGQVTEEKAVPRVIETVDVGTGKNFLWPAIEKGDW